ncbi:MAG: SPOR domain-containing protein [Acidobacteria bacterium]|jgi:hypothetical protein|nr:SPOR domain-containing protein [Acidobacteriota bacterium]
MTRSDEPRVFEFELNLLSLALVAAALLALLGGAFVLGRASVPGESARAGDAVRGAVPGRAAGATGGGVEQIGPGTIFDSAGEGERNRAPQFQVTREGSRAGRFTLEIGRASSRVVAGKFEEAARSAGVPAAVVTDGRGGYLVTGGPYTSRADADRAGARLGKLLGRSVTVRESPARP